MAFVGATRYHWIIATVQFGQQVNISARVRTFAQTNFSKYPQMEGTQLIFQMLK